MPVVLAILVLLIAGGWFYLYSGKNNFHLSQGSALADSTAVSKIPVHNSSLQPSAEPARKEPPLEKKHSAEQDTAKPTKPKTTALAEGDSTQEYTVVNKAWFHYAPDSTKRKPLFLQPREDLVLIPTAEENGFVYVVYVNKKGQSTHGWLDKRDLEPLD